VKEDGELLRYRLVTVGPDLLLPLWEEEGRIFLADTYAPLELPATTPLEQLGRADLPDPYPGLAVPIEISATRVAPSWGEMMAEAERAFSERMVSRAA
jgi:hypothetical protein